MDELVLSAAERLSLTISQARILGALLEKQATTPEVYPLTANAVLLACNQKNNRDPVLELEAGEVGHALRELEADGLIRSVHGTRAQRYEHRFAQAFSVTLRQQAILGVMLLRGPQTIGELFSRCERLTDFSSAEDVRQALERLQHRTPSLAVCVGRTPGQREDRYMHLLSGPVDVAAFASHPARISPIVERPDLEDRVAALEIELAALRDRLDALSHRPD